MTKLKDLTPTNMRCPPSRPVLCCPTIVEITPSPCSYSACPSMWEREGGYWIVGKLGGEEVGAVPDEVAAKVGPGEAPVWIPRELLANINKL